MYDSFDEKMVFSRVDQANDNTAMKKKKGSGSISRRE